MNFHKTIGFLATLLLVLGLGVPDSFAQPVNVNTITLSHNLHGDGGNIADDGTSRQLVITAVINVSAGDATSMNLVLGVGNKDEGTTAEPADYTGISTVTVPVSITASNAAQDITVSHVFNNFSANSDDDFSDEAIAITGEMGNVSATPAIITIADADIGVTAVTLESNAPGTGFADSNNPSAVEVTVSVTLEADVPNNDPDTDEAVTVSVTIDDDPEYDDQEASPAVTHTAESGDYANIPSATVQVVIPEGSGSSPVTAVHIISFTPMSDADTDQEIVVIKGTVDEAQTMAGADIEAVTTLQINDGGNNIQTVTITELMPNSVDEPANAAAEATSTIMVKVKVDMQYAVESATTVTVAVSADEAHADHTAGVTGTGSYTTAGTVNGSVVIAADSRSSEVGTIEWVFTANSDTDAEDETIVVQAVAQVLDSGGSPIATNTGTGRSNLAIEDASDTGVASLTFKPDAVSVNETDGPKAVTINAEVSLGAALALGADPVTVTISLSRGSRNDGDNLEDDDVAGTATTASERIFVSSPGVTAAALSTGPDVSVVIEAGKQTGSTDFTVNFDPVADEDSDNEMLVINGDVDGANNVADMLTITIREPAAPTRNLTLALSPNNVNDDAGATMVTVTATVDLGASVTVVTSTTVALTVASHAANPAESGDYTISTLENIEVTISSGQTGSGTSTFTITPAVDTDDTDPEIIVIQGTATVDGATLTGFQNFTINESAEVMDQLPKNAVDASGFRLTIAAPGVGKWAKAAKNQVKVQLHRRAGLASDFGNYETIKVSLYDEDIQHNDDNERLSNADVLYSISVTEDSENAQLTNLAMASMETDSLSMVTGENVGTPNATTNIVAYERRTRTGKYDVLEFRFNIPKVNGAADLRKVYAVATFTSGNISGTAEIESRDTETTIYPANPSAFPDKVGDGKLVMIDRNPPADNIIGNLTVNITDENDNAMGAGIGDEIELTGTVDVPFRDHSVVFHIIHEMPATVNDDGTDVVVIKRNEALVGFSKTFSATAVFDAVNAGDPLSHEFKVTQNQFKRKYTAKDPREDPKFAKNDTREDDQMTVMLRAQVKDVAGNATTQGTSAEFTLDSKPPKIKILYPKPSAPDSNRFTAGAMQEYEFIGEGGQEVDLNPLKFNVDEGLSAAYVVVDGNHAARNDTTDIGVDLIDGDNIVDLTDTDNEHRVYERTDNGKDDSKRASKEGFYNKGTKTAKVTVAATDMSGNTAKATPDGGDPIFDNLPAKLTKLFPNTTDLEPYDLKIGGSEGTQNPVFRLNEAVDSILARYEGGGDILEVVGTDAQNSTVDNNIRIKFMGDNALRDGELYDLQVYVRDLAGHVTLSDRQDGLTFEESLSNPAAGAFKLATNVRAWDGNADPAAAGFVKMDSVVANQAMRLTITALDAALSESAGEDRVAITYAESGVKVVVMDSDGNPEPTAKFWGGASGNGTATLNDLGWSGGERNIFFQVTNAGSYTVAVKDMNADGTVNFMKTTDIVVDAADFQKFVITSTDDDFDPADSGTVWEDFDLMVTPTDNYGNASLKTFNNFAGTGKVAPVAAQDSLDILDTRVGKTAPAPENAGNSTKKYTHVDVNFATSLIEDLPFSWSVAQAGDTFSVRTQEGRTRGTARVRAIVDNDFLLVTDLRSKNRSGEASFTIQQPVDISITLWVPGKDGDQAGQTVEIPAGGTVAVTARAEGLNEGDSVTLSSPLGSVDMTADANGHAAVTVPLSGSGSVTVTATSGQNSESLEVVYEEQSGRMAFVDANGDPVYLVDLSDNTVDQNDIMAFVIAYLSDAGESNYNPQADANDDGTVDDDDLALIVTSWLKTAVNGPATKPIVMPGVNQNAEFALSLGSERVVAGELVAVDVSLANVEAVMGYGFDLNYDAAKFEFVSVAPADEDLLTSTGGETLSHHVVTDGQVHVVTGLYNGTAVSGGGDIVRFVFRVLYEFEDNARFEIANGLVFDPSQLSNPAVVAGVLELQSTPREFALHQNFPNPFNPDTTIKYDLAESADVTLQIYNVLGQVVRTLVASEAQNAGRYQIRWNGMDERGVPVSSGIYFYQISADGKFSDVRKLMLLK
ncbi:MAG: T9SS type A sorting domain-containing protein [Gemmatimonadota bacterium]|nr:T9SS type A sorting domain-containing protein [Gemmatimonadota bacterium]